MAGSARSFKLVIDVTHLTFKPRLREACGGSSATIAVTAQDELVKSSIRITR
jgi:hypothetical protein